MAVEVDEPGDDEVGADVDDRRGLESLRTCLRALRHGSDPTVVADPHLAEEAGRLRRCDCTVEAQRNDPAGDDESQGPLLARIGCEDARLSAGATYSRCSHTGTRALSRNPRRAPWSEARGRVRGHPRGQLSFSLGV